MSLASPAALATGAVHRGRVSDFITLAKPRVNSLVLVTTGLGYLLAANGLSAWRLFHTLLGTGLVAAGSAAFNQIWEKDLDAKMLRTAGRPLPAGRIEPAAALAFAATLSAVGLLDLAFAVNALAAALAGFTLVSYVLCYTPLKRLSSLSTVAGAIPGAMPPVIGWAAAAGRLDPPAGVLFGILFLWQMPHFLAIAWLCRQDYARAGLPMLPVLEPDGAATGRQAALYALTLLPVSLALSGIHATGDAYLVGAALLGAAFSVFAILFAIRRTDRRARTLFLASIAYLPALLLLAYLDRTGVR